MSSYFSSFFKATPPLHFVDHTKLQAPKITPETPWHGYERYGKSLAPPQNEFDKGLVQRELTYWGGTSRPEAAGSDSVVVKNNIHRYKVHKALNQICGNPGASARLSCVGKDSAKQSRTYRPGPWYNPYSYGDGEELVIHNERLLDGTVKTLLAAYPQWGFKNMIKIASGMRKAIGAMQERMGTHHDMHAGQFMFKYVDKGGDFIVNGKNAIVVLHDMDDVTVNKNYDRKGEHLTQYMKAIWDMFHVLLENYPDAAPEWHAKFSQLDAIMSPFVTHENLHDGFSYINENVIEITYAQKGANIDEKVPWNSNTYVAAVRKFDKILNSPAVPNPNVPVQGLALKKKDFLSPFWQKEFSDIHADMASSDIVGGLSALNEHHLQEVYKFKYGLLDVKVTQLSYTKNTNHPIFVVTWPSTTTNASYSKYGVDVTAYKKFKEEYKAMQAKHGEVSNAVPLSSFSSLVSAIKSGKYGRGNNMENLLKSPVGQFLETASAIFDTHEASWSEWVGLTPTQVVGDLK